MKYLIEFFDSIGDFFLLLYGTIRWSFKKPFDKKNLANQIIKIGINSIPIVLVTALFTGMVMSLQIAFSLEYKIKGASSLIGGVIGVAMMRELGPVFSAVFLSGRVGSGIAAELGSMKVTDQVDALYTLDTSPVHYLVVPRFLAAIIVLPMLTLFADFIGIFGSMLVTTLALKVPFLTFWYALRNGVSINDLLNGLIKSVFFAMIIVIVGALSGLKTKNGAEGVGQSTTQSVVISSISILVVDYFLTIFLSKLLHL